MQSLRGHGLGIFVVDNIRLWIVVVGLGTRTRRFADDLAIDHSNAIIRVPFVPGVTERKYRIVRFYQEPCKALCIDSFLLYFIDWYITV